jgi:omega-6 fatty acid desaturase (delta-12 desaturase)
LRAEDAPSSSPGVSKAIATKAKFLNLAKAQPSIDANLILKRVAPYRQPRTARSLGELAITAAPFFLLWGLAAAAVQAGYLAGLLLTIPAGLFLLRLFLIQHDCGHGAFFHRRGSNDWLGRALGLLTFTPYEYWRQSHAQHHASTGNLDRRGFGDVDTLTVDEYRRLGRGGRLRYRLYRHPLILFGLGPAYLFLLRHRLPVGMMRRGWRPWLSALGTNVGIAALCAPLIWIVGFKTFLLVQLPVTLVAASLGVWLFYVQHQFEATQWDRQADWSFPKTALHGSSYYVLPPVMRWFTASIGVHHVHHLASRIPFYRLAEVMRDIPALASCSRLSVRESLRTVRLVLWDEKGRRLISWKEARKA